jgi:Zn-dependent M28 family amino/carboxypeptidase
VRRYSSPDVIGIIPGSDPGLKEQYVALMAHVDHIGITPGTGGDRINNGALDNAAGTAALLEVARALTSLPRRPARSILLVANTAEEKGLLGAEFLAHYPPVPIDHIVAAIDLDMPLLLYDFTDVVAYGASHSTLERAFRDAGRAMGIEVSPDPMPEQAIFVRSDHYPFAKAGVPAVMLATGMKNGGEAAWSSFLEHQYHHPDDDLKQPIHWQAGARFAELNYRAVRELADAPEPPRWYAGDYFGGLFAPSAPKVPR